MKKSLLFLSILLFQTIFLQAQTAREVLEKCASVVSNKEGVKASFRMESARYGNASGVLYLKGNQFCAQTDMATMWFDGKTQWTYLKKNDEVTVTVPNETQQQSLNPYNFINLYKKGYKETMTTGTAFSVHLTSIETSKKISEVFITIDKKSYAPSEVKVLQGQKWTTFYISNFEQAKLSDSIFCFNSKDYPTAEVIDMR